MRSKGLMALVCTFNIWQNIARKLQHVLLNMKAATLLVIKCCGKCFESTIRNFQKLYRNSLILVNLNHFKNQQKMFLTPPPPPPPHCGTNKKIFFSETIMNCYLTSSYQSFCCFTWGGVCLQT